MSEERDPIDGTLDRHGPEAAAAAVAFGGSLLGFALGVAAGVACGVVHARTGGGQLAAVGIGAGLSLLLGLPAWVVTALVLGRVAEVWCSPDRAAILRRAGRWALLGTPPFVLLLLPLAALAAG